MVKFVQCVTRKPGMETITFRTHWNSYGKRVEELVRDRPNVLRFCLSTTLLVDATITFMADYGASAPYDGMVELWLDDATITAANLRDPKSKPIFVELTDLLREFVDRDKSTAFFAAEDMGFDRELAAAASETIRRF
jgi:hypothetical protein